MKWLVLFALLVAGCSSPGQGMAFVVNRTQAAQAPGSSAEKGKSYSLPLALLEQRNGGVALSSGPDAVLEAANVTLPPSEWVGKNLPLSGGKLVLEGKETPVESGELSLQTLQDGVYRGNFNAQLGRGLEAVGYFEARLKQP